MEPVVIVLLGVVGLVLVLAVVAISVYNGLVSRGTGYANAFAQIDVQLKRRHDLIPNLVETAKAYLGHEKGTLEAVIQARNQAVSGLQAVAAKPGDAAAIAGLSGAEGALGASLGRLFALAEAYPDLKANTAMAQLTEELSSTENRIAFARQAYNDAVMQFNQYRRSFPPVVFAGLFGYSEDATALQFADRMVIQEAPKVKF